LEKKLNNIFSNTECISTDEMINFLNSNLSEKENNRIEKHLLSCDMCKDEIEGIAEMINVDKIDKIVFELNKKIDNRIKQKTVKTIFFKRSYLQIAAVILILISSTFFINNFINFSAKEMQSTKSVSQNLSEETEEAVEEMVEDDFITEELAEEETAASVETEFKEKVEESRKIEAAVLESMHKDKTIDDEIEAPTTENANIVEEETETSEGLEVNESEDDFSAIGYTNAVAFDESDKKLRIETNKENINNNIKTDRAKEVTTKKKERQKIFFSNRRLNKAKTSNKKSNQVVADEKNISEIKNSEPTLNPNSNRSARKGETNIYNSELQSDFYFKKGLKNYYEKNYKSAKKYFEQSIKFKNNANSNYYLALTFLALNNNKKAIEYLNKVFRYDNSKYFDEALWKKAIILIKTGKRKSASNLLNDIFLGKGKYSKQAKVKLDSMKVD